MQLLQRQVDKYSSVLIKENVQVHLSRLLLFSLPLILYFILDINLSTSTEYKLFYKIC